MSRLFYHVCQDNAGNLLLNVQGTMRLAGTGTNATIYGDEALTVILPNPMTNHASFGSFKCFLGAGDYDFYMAKAGYTFETLTGVQGHGTMAQQDGNAVLISGGSATGLTSLSATTIFGTNIGTDGLTADTATIDGGTLQGISLLHVTGTTVLGRTAIGDGAAPSEYLRILHTKAAYAGITIRPSDTDTGAAEVQFINYAGGGVGSIATTATTTAYLTSSDARLKTAITPLTGALDVVQRLRPVAFRWNSDDSPGHGFLASEVQAVIPEGVITGDEGAVDEEGKIQPQMIDYSKLVPWLTAAVKELAQQVEALTARLAAVGG